MTAAPRQSRPRSPWRRLALVAGLLGATILAVSLVNRNFASPENFRDLLVQSAPTIIVGCGMTLVVLCGEIDISVGSAMGLLAALMGIFVSPQHLGLPVWLTVGLVLACGAGIGLVNGLLVTIGRVPSIIATLGMMTVLRGTTELVLGGRWITDLPEGLRWLGTGSIAHVPICIWAAGALVGAFLLLTRHTRFGLHVYAIGGNPVAAGMARVPAVRVRIAAFMAVGLLTAVATLVSAPQQSVVEAGIGSGFELVVITAVVVGGTSIRGGYGGITGMLLAALLLGSIRTSILFLNLGQMATYWERAIQGAFILAAVLTDHLTEARDPASSGATA